MVEFLDLNEIMGLEVESGDLKGDLRGLMVHLHSEGKGIYWP